MTKIILNQQEDLEVPQSSVLVWDEITIKPQVKELRVKYHWEDGTGNVIALKGGETRKTWYCRDQADDPETPEDDSSTCFTDTFGFEIRSQDVGVKIGIGLRNLIWNKMKQEILTAGNDGAFE